MVVNSSSESFVPRNSTRTLMRSQYCDWWRLPSCTKENHTDFFLNHQQWHILCQNRSSMEEQKTITGGTLTCIPSLLWMGCKSIVGLSPSPPSTPSKGIIYFMDTWINFIWVPGWRKTSGEKTCTCPRTQLPQPRFDPYNRSGLFPW